MEPIGKKFNYVYTVTLPSTGEYYHGSRSCDCLPENDKYLGSFKKWKPNKKELIKQILKNFDNRIEAFKYEIEIIKKDINDPLNRNYMIPNLTFTFMGLSTVRLNENSEKTFVIAKNDPLKSNYYPALKGKYNGMYGTSDYNIWVNKYGKEEADRRLLEIKQIRSINAKGEKNNMYNKSLQQVWLEKGGIEYCNMKKIIYHENMSKATSSEKNGMYNKSLYNNWLEKGGKDFADMKMEKYSKSRQLIGIHNPNTKEKKFVKKELLDELLDNGWIKGWKFSTL